MAQKELSTIKVHFCEEKVDPTLRQFVAHNDFGVRDRILDISLVRPPHHDRISVLTDELDRLSIDGDQEEVFAGKAHRFVHHLKDLV